MVNNQELHQALEDNDLKAYALKNLYIQLKENGLNDGAIYNALVNSKFRKVDVTNILGLEPPVIKRGLPKYTDEEIRIRKMVCLQQAKQGYCLVEISRQTGISRKLVETYVMESGFTNEQWLNARRWRAGLLIKSGKTLSEVFYLTGLSTAEVEKVIVNNNLQSYVRIK